MGPASKPVWLGQLELRVFFFFSSRSLVCRCHRGRCTSEAERTRWARLPSRCGSASWSFGSFFFPPEALSVAVTRGACTSDAERTRWARLPGRCGPVSWSFGSFFFFFFSSRSPPLCPCHRGPCTSEAEGKLWARFSFIDLSVLSVLPVVRSTSCSFEVRFFSLWGHFWATSPGMTSRYSLWPVTFLPVSFMLVIFSICSYWTWR